MISNKEREPRKLDAYIKEKIYQESHLWVVEGSKKICGKCGGSGNKKEETECANCQGTGYQPFFKKK